MTLGRVFVNKHEDKLRSPGPMKNTVQQHTSVTPALGGRDR